MSDSKQNIVELLVESGLIPAKDQKRVTVTAIEGEIVRRPEMSSRRFTISVDGQPKYSLKFLPANWPYSTEDILETISRYSQFTSINVPKLVAHFETKSGRYFVDEFLEAAMPLGELIDRGTVGTGQALELMRAIYLEIYGCGRKPAREFVDSQKRSILNSMTHLVREGVWGEFILRYVEKTIDDNASFLREVYSSGDIIDRNIVLSNGQWYLIDYEYSHRTIFGFKDAFRNILYTRWARNYTLVDLYPPLKNFPQDVASMISVAWEYRFQTEILDDQAREVTQKHLRYVFWNALDPMIISQLDKRLVVVEEQARQREREISRLKEEEIASVRASLQEKANVVSRLEAELRAKQEESMRFQEHSALQLKRINDLIKEIDTRQARIEEFRKESDLRSNRITELTNWSDDLQHQIRVQGDRLKIQQQKLDETFARLEDQTRLNREQVADYIYIKSTLSYSLGRILTLPPFLVFKLIVWLYKGVDAVLGRYFWPQGSKRSMILNALEHLPETIATATYLLRMHGPDGLLKGVRDTWKAGVNLGILRNRHPSVKPSIVQGRLPNRQQQKVVKPLPRPELNLVAETGVSIVIPVLNEKDNLSVLLPSLLSQKGFTGIDIIVVDSGSTDDSVALAMEYGVKVLQIPPKDFSHSGTRNLGASKARQDYILSMTADALPTSDTWLYQMYRFLKDEGLAAVSCKEVPRADVDLFSRVQMWNHYAKFLELTVADKILTLPKKRDPMTMRKHAQLTDVACLMSKEIFLKYKYRYEYGEDLDLGLRLISDGLRIGLMSSARVIHSHRRPAYYHLKRAYVDKLVIGQILNDAPSADLNLSEILPDILGTWLVVDQLSVSNLMQGEISISVADLVKRIRTGIAGDHRLPNSPIKVGDDHPFVDRRFAEFLLNLSSISAKIGVRPKVGGQIHSGLNHFLVLAFEYMEETYDHVDELIVKDAIDLVFKQFAVLCGAYIASCSTTSHNGENSTLKALQEELGGRDIVLPEMAGAGKVEAQ